MYRSGWGKQEIDIEPQGYAMFGYGQWHHRATDRRTALYARALYIADAHGNTVIFCCLDLGCITGAIRAGVSDALRAKMGAAFNDASLVLTATHTHSGPGGCSFEALYNIPTPGFVPEHLAAVVVASASAIISASQTALDTELSLQRSCFAEDIPVAWNRSLPAYNRNPDVTQRTESETHLALDRAMAVLSLRRAGELHALLSLFGVHATCLGNTLHSHDGDNKGYAAALAEQALAQAGVADGVAIFAQASAGDVSPHYHGKGDVARRKALKGDAEVAYAVQNGRYQSELALSAGQEDEHVIHGEIDAILSFIDFTAIHASAEFSDGNAEAWTSDPCHGAAFFQGTRVDGPGTPALLISAVEKLADTTRAWRLSPLMRRSQNATYYRRLYAAQSPKSILLEAVRKQILGRPMDGLPLPNGIDPTIDELKRQIKAGAINDSPLVPTRLPLQIIVIGQLALVCCPGEFTTVAGQRMLDTVRERLTSRGVTEVLICTYCNDYMGYVTTQQEYQQQAYEGGHTLFGQWTLAAFQTCYAGLAEQLCKPDVGRSHDRVTRPLPVPLDELAKRSYLPVPR